MKINPVLRKELKIMGRTVKTSVIIFMYNIILTSVSLYVFFEMLDNQKFTGAIEYSYMLQIYIIMAYIEFFLLLLIVPGLTAGSIAGERERQTLDVLLVTNMRPWQIVLGKIESSIAMVGLLVICSLPIVSLVFVFGGIRIIELLFLIGLLILEAVFLGSIGILFSTMLKKTTAATVVTYATLLVIVGGTYLAVIILYKIAAWNWGGDMSQQVDVGNLIYILLINPAFTFAGLIGEQAGSNQVIINMCNTFGTYDNTFIIQHWIPISLLIQISVTIFLLCLSSHFVKPLRIRKGSQKRRRDL